jgi:predicted nucleotidyltransferase component of viral defense system
MLKVWNSKDHRATMDIDLLARTSNQIANLQNIITEVASIQDEGDAISFDTQKLILRQTQTGGDYQGVSASFFAQLYTTRMPVFIDIGFNDVIVPKPQRIHYPTLLEMPTPILMGYTLETVIAEKFESIVKLALVNTRMKDFYDLWTIFRMEGLDFSKIKLAILEVFTNRGTQLKYPAAFTPTFYAAPETELRWNNFLSSMGKERIEFKEIIEEISTHIRPIIELAS